MIYTLLTIQAALSLFGTREPWTVQFTRRVLPPQVWSRPEFRAMNRFATMIWVGCFAACDAMALLVRQPLRLYLPIATMIACAAVSRRLSRVYLARQLEVPVSDLPPEWTAAPSTQRA